MNRIIIIFLVLFSITFLSAKDSERDLYYKRAQALTRQKQYEKAFSLYQQILKKYEPATNIIKNYLNLVLQIHQNSFLAELKKYETNLAEIDYLILSITYFQKVGDIDKSHKIANAYLKKNSNKMNDYKRIANIFTSQRDNKFAIKILEDAQKIGKDEFLYSLDLAKNYQSILNYKKSLKFYSLYLTKNKNYQHYIFNQLKTVLIKDKSIIEIIEKNFGKSDKEWVREIYARSLSELGEFDKSMNVYKTLSEDKFIKFANQIMKENKLDIAKKTYEIIIEQTKKPLIKFESKYKIAQILLRQNLDVEAKKLLIEITTNKNLQNKNNRYKSNINKDARLLLAEISIRENASQKEVISYFEDAKKYAYHAYQQQITLAEINYLILLGKFDDSKKMMAKLENKNLSGDVAKQLNYQKFLVSIMKNETTKDSLLGELVLQIPENILTQQALELSTITQKVTDKDTFFKIYRKYKNYDFTAIEEMHQFAKKSNNEKLIILAGEWALANNQNTKAIEILSHKFEDEDLSALSKTYLIKLTNNSLIAEDFLTKLPYNILSPELRMLLQNYGAKKR